MQNIKFGNIIINKNISSLPWSGLTINGQKSLYVKLKYKNKFQFWGRVTLYIGNIWEIYWRYISLY